MFDRGRLEIEQRDCRLHRFPNGCEEDQAESFLPRQRRNLQLRGEDRGQCAFAAGQNLVEVIWRTREPFDPVAGPAFQQARRPAVRHLRGMCAHEIADLIALVG